MVAARLYFDSLLNFHDIMPKSTSCFHDSKSYHVQAVMWSKDGLSHFTAILPHLEHLAVSIFVDLARGWGGWFDF